MSDLYDIKISVRSSVKLLLEIKGLLSMKPNRERLFRDTVFELWLDIQSHKNDSHMMHYVFQHQASAEFIKGLDDQDGTFFQDDQCREKCMEQHNKMCGDTEDGTFVDKVVGKICPKINRMSVDDGDGVLDSQTKDVIEEAAMLPTMSSNSPQAGNVAVFEFFAEFDALKKEVLLIKRRKDDEFDELTKRSSKLETSKTFVKFKKLLTNDLCTENESSDCNPKKSDGGVTIEEKTKFSSQHNDSSNHIGGVSSEAKASSSSAHPGNDEDVSHLDDNMEIDGQNAKDGYSNSQHNLHLLIKALGTKIENSSIDSVVVVPPKVDDPMLRTIKPKDDFDEADVDSYDDDYMSLFNDEEQPAKSSLNDLELQQEPDKVDVKDGILEQQAIADKGKTTVIQETVGVTVDEGPSLGRGLGTLKFKKKNYERALRNYIQLQFPTKRKTRLKKTDDIVMPFDLEDISGQPRNRSINHIMTHDPFVENLSRPDGCKSDKVTVPEYMSAFITNKDLPEYWFPWGKRDIVIDRSFWLRLSCLNIGKSGWLTDQHLDLWIDLMWSLRPPEADWAIIRPHFSACILNRMMSDYFLNGHMYPLPWIAVEKVYFLVNEPKEHWCLTELEIRTGVVTFYDSLGWAGRSRRLLAFNSQPKSDKILLGFGVRPGTLDLTIIKVAYPRGGHRSWYVSVFTLSSMDWKKLDNDCLPRESIRFKCSSQVVIGRLIFWAGHERFVSDDGHVVFKKHLLVSFDLIGHSFKVHDIDVVFRDGLTVPMCLSSLGNSLILFGSMDETDFYLFVHSFCMLAKVAGTLSLHVKLNSMSSPSSPKFKVILVYEEIKCGVLLPKNISQKNFVRYVRKKFNVEDNKELLLSYNIGSNSFNIIDEDDVDFFLKAVLESGDVVMSVFIKSTEKTVEVTPSKPLDIDLNIPLFHEPVTHEWMKNSLNYLPPTPHAPILDLKSITTSHHGVKFSAKKIADKEACMYEIGLKCITEGYEYKVVRSCPERYAVECVHLDCYWYIFTRRIKKENGFRVTYINDNHTCPKTQFYPNHRNATTKMLCQLIILKFRDVTRVYRPKDIINDLNIEFNIDVSYKRAWKGKQLALKSNQGDPISSFAQLPYYCYNLKLANKNTITHIDTDHEGRFKMLSIAFGAAVRI
ncbi:phospholipase-like protein [Tanacetum coccineum]